jgi:hypothetical protein
MQWCDTMQVLELQREAAMMLNPGTAKTRVCRKSGEVDPQNTNNAHGGGPPLRDMLLTVGKQAIKASIAY